MGDSKWTPERTKQFKLKLEQRLQEYLSWYSECIVCDETLKNVRADVQSALKKTCEEFNLDKPNFSLATFFDDDGFIVVKFVGQEKN